MIYTAYECDRCNQNNALRLRLAVNKDKLGNVSFEEIDLCSKCIINMCGALFSRVEWDDREPWVQAFVKNIIG